MKICVTGWQGKIGSKLIKRGCIPLDCDITNQEEVNERVGEINPDTIIHCAAMTDVDWCERNEKDAFKVNCRGTGNLVDAFTGNLIYLSTFQVFDGMKYLEMGYTEKHKANPVNTYGWTKWGGEQVLRYGVSNYKVIRLGRIFDYAYIKPHLTSFDNGAQLEFPNFMVRSFTYIEHVLDALMYVAEHFNDLPNLMNIASQGAMDYFRFWQSTAHMFGYDTNLVQARDWELIGYTPRPPRAGLCVDVAKRYKVPIHTTVEGLQDLKNDQGA